MTFFESINPCTQECIDSIQETPLNTIDSYVDLAVSSWHAWKSRHLSDRITILHSFAKLLEQKKKTYIDLISQETGKPFWEATLEVNAAIAKVTLSLQAHQDRLNKVSYETNDAHLEVAYKPIGVLTVLGPFNFPVLLPLGHIIPALLVGNAVVFKPSEFTSVVGQWIIKLLYEAGVPPEVLSMVLGGGAQGAYLVAHPKIQGVLFTGGYQTAVAISKSLAETPEKMLALECGGNNPLIVSSFNDQDTVVDCLVKSAFLTTGQRCTSMRRLIIIKNSNTRSLLDHFIKQVGALRVGSMFENPEPFMGPLISEKAKEQFFNSASKMKALGAHILYESHATFDRGFFVTPVIVDVSHCYKTVPDIECFGPLLHVIHVDSLDEAIDVANHTTYGLSASLISTNAQEFDRVFNSVNAGIINWNKPTNGASSQLPFGGIGKSGNFRPAGYFAVDSCVYPVASVRNKQVL